jgi:hypothetical protein
MLRVFDLLRHWYVDGLTPPQVLVVVLVIEPLALGLRSPRWIGGASAGMRFLRSVGVGMLVEASGALAGLTVGLVARHVVQGVMLGAWLGAIITGVAAVAGLAHDRRFMPARR